MSEAGREIELKFAVPADRAEAVWKAAAPGADLEGRTLVSTYFDTADRRLSNADMALRLRSDGKRTVQTLKAPDAHGFARAEHEAQVDGGRVDLARLAETPAGPLLDGARLEPLFTVEVRRRKAMISQGKAEIELCLDTGFVEAAGRREAISEIELELKSGPPAALFAAARRLMRRRLPAPLTLAFETKAARGFRLLEGGRKAGSAVRPGMDAAAAFTAIGEASLAQIAKGLAALREEVAPEAVHDLRVGLRRLRSARSTFKAMLADRESEAMAGALKAMAHAMDETRDLDVLAESAAGADAAFHATVEAARERARADLQAVLAGPQARDLPLKIASWLAVGGWRRTRLRAVRTLREQPAAEFAAQAMDRRLKKLHAGTDLAELTPEARHERRIRIKKLRYAAEAFAPLFDERPKRRKRMIAALKEAQERLGALNDDAVGREIAHRLVSESGNAEAAFAAGAAFAPDPRRDAKRLKAAQEAWDALFEVTPFWR